MKTTHPHVASLIFGRPLMVHRSKLAAIVNGIAARIGMDPYMPDDEDEDDDEDRLDAGAPSTRARTDSGTAIIDGIAVIGIYGTLVKRCTGMDAMSGLVSYEDLSAQVLEAATDPRVKGILLDIDSFGGECNGAFDLGDLIYKARKTVPVYAVANSYALSAGYLIASAADKLFVTQEGMVGSVGVIAVHCDQSGFDQQIGLKYETITFGAHKDDFSPHAPLSDDARQELKNDINRLGELFVAAVARNRAITPDAVRATQAGLLSGGAAIQIGMADQVGSRDDAMKALLAAIPKEPSGNPELDSAASASAAAISQKGDTNMSQETRPAETTLSPETQKAVEAALASSAATHKEIFALCAIAAGTDTAKAKQLAGEFIEQGLTASQVREKLVAARAEEKAGPDIETSFLPQGELSKAAMNNPNRLVEAVKRRILGRTSRGRS